jgi:hypothetical protein
MRLRTGAAGFGRATPGVKLLAVASVWTVLIAGCGSDGSEEPDEQAQESLAPLQPQTATPADEVTVIEDEAPGALAIGVSRALYAQAPVVYVAGEADPAGQTAAAEAATALGVPVLLTPTEDGGTSTPSPSTDPASEPLRDELARLGAATVVAAGEPAAAWAGRLDGITVVPASPAPALPPVTPPEPLDTVTVLARDTEATVAASATARAAGARVLTTERPDPRTDNDVIEALAEAPPSHTIAVGDGFGSPDRLRDRLAVAATGVQLPGGGQVLFPGRRFVALYGHPGDPGLGVLGEQPVGESIDRAQEVAAEYDSLVDEPVIPAFEIITTVASASAGPTRDYSRRTPVDRLRPWIDAAHEAGAYVVLDLQPGRTDFLTQAKEYEELLVEPHVGLALDPEWRLAPDQRHLEQIGSVDAAEVNEVVEWLADLTAEHRLPQKLLILHQFTLQMIADRADVHTGRDELAVLIHADGFGTPTEKFNTWDALHANPPPDVWWGWKNFYDEDQPTFTPERTVDISPSPVFISYQ